MSKITSLKEQLYFSCPNYYRIIDSNDLIFNENELLKIRKNTNINGLKSKKLIPENWDKEDYLEFITAINKYKKKIKNQEYHKNHKRSELTKEKDRLAQKERYEKNKSKKLEYLRLYAKLVKHFYNHRESMKDTLLFISKLDPFHSKKFTIRQLTQTTINEDTKILVSIIKYIRKSNQTTYYL